MDRPADGSAHRARTEAGRAVSRWACVLTQGFAASANEARSARGWSRACEPDARVLAERLYHGTIARSLPSIRRQGLTAQGRTHVHLSERIEEAIEVARRRGAPVILEVRASALAAHGVRLERSSSGVWLAERVPPELVSVLRTE